MRRTGRGRGGNGASDIAPHVWPIALFLAIVSLIAMWRYRQTLD
jgi:ABC-2 type transport system permease protein